MPVKTKCANCGRSFEYTTQHHFQLKMGFMNFKDFCSDRCLREYKDAYGGQDTSAGKGFMGLW